MKYVRTKDGIIDTEKLFNNYKNSGGLWNYNDWYLFLTKDTKILNFSDFLETICDEFVLVNEYRFKRPKTATELEKDFYEMRSFYTNKNDKIYGAIWIYDSNDVPTLTPVAKMNEKGELELI